MKLKYWGVETAKAEKLIGPSPVVVANEDEFYKLFEKLDGVDVMIAKLKDEVACPKCGEVNEFVAYRANGRLEDVFCNECGVEITNSPETAEGYVSQEDWETIVFELTC